MSEDKIHSGPFWIKVEFVGDPHGAVAMRVGLPETGHVDNEMVADMLAHASAMARRSKLVIVSHDKARENRIWHALKAIGSMMRAPKESDIKKLN